MPTISNSPNSLIHENSPYLRQHANNPVNWYAWNDSSIALAKQKNKPIFLSIGYSTCYWCHVMEREVFENPEIAELMNKYFINIKVDREERPDIDRIYMTALQAMTGMGGWPMSMFLTPDLKPFYGATYIPPKSKYNQTGFEDVIEKINTVWQEKHDEVLNSGNQVVNLLSNKVLKSNVQDEDITITEDVLHKAFEQFKSVYDYSFGGFGQGNKFPRPAALDFLNVYFKTFGNIEAFDMVTFTLMKMYTGGIHDHLNGGFHRYSVDHVWRVPHFEKMLYDQAQIINTLLDVHSISGKQIYLHIAASTINYVLNYMQDEQGGFYSAEDAESMIKEGDKNSKSEGAFYLWDKNEIDKILPADHAGIFEYYYGILPAGNTLNDPHNVLKEKNVLYVAHDIHDTAKVFGKSEEEIFSILESCRKKLVASQSERPRPFLDKKIITSWNAMMSSALSKAFKKTGNKRFLNAAVNCINFLKRSLIDTEEPRLYRRFINGERRFSATLEDYALLIKALIDLYEVTFDDEYIELASSLNILCIKNFYDRQNAGFFDSEKSDDIIFPTKDPYDGSEPSGNSIQILNLFRLSVILDESAYFDMAERSLIYFYDDIRKSPFSSPLLLISLLNYLKGAEEIVVGKKAENELIGYVYSKYLPFAQIIKPSEFLAGKNELIKEILNDEPNGHGVFVCHDFKCEKPALNLEELKEIIK